MMYFLDTNVLLDNFEYYSSMESKFLISSETLIELERIKTNRNKTEEIRSYARKAIKWLSNNSEKYDVIQYVDNLDDQIENLGLLYCGNAPDIRICCCAWLADGIYTNEKIVFVTNDISCKNIAHKLFHLNVEDPIINTPIEYSGYKEIIMDDEMMAYFYEHPNDNKYGLLVNEYLIVRDHNNNIVDSYRWDGEKFCPTKIGNIKSELFGVIKPFKGDIYQQCLLNSFINNSITMVKGKAGSGKTYCALGYLFSLLEKHKIDKIILFTNTQPTINTARLGFYPGTRDEKMLESSVGNILSSKLGDGFMVEKLVSEGKLILLPMCDIRGYDTSNMKAGVLITEAQNLNIELMKLALQRIGDDSICIIDGDYNAQVDSEQYAGENNGMRRLSEVFRGQNFYGEIELKNIYRSKIAELAEKM